MRHLLSCNTPAIKRISFYMRSFFNFSFVKQKLIRLSTAITLMALIPMGGWADLPLPTGLVSLESPAGQQLLLKSDYQTSYWPLSRYFVSEQNIAFCSIASLVMVLNALNIQRPFAPDLYPYPLFTQDDVFYNPKVMRIFQPRQVAAAGLTLEQLATLASILGGQTQVHFAKNNQDLSDFINTAKKILSNPKSNSYLIINYNRNVLGQIGGGHFSPLAAYDPTTDRFLLMDVARYKYPPTWVKSQDLWHAMESVDSTSQKPRGYLVIGA